MIASLLFRLKALSIYEGIDVVNVRARNADMKQSICNYLFGIRIACEIAALRPKAQRPLARPLVGS